MAITRKSRELGLKRRRRIGGGYRYVTAVAVKQVLREHSRVPFQRYDHEYNNGPSPF